MLGPVWVKAWGSRHSQLCHATLKKLHLLGDLALYSALKLVQVLEPGLGPLDDVILGRLHVHKLLLRMCN